jgi:NADH:ubiquinone oxidoreductase subunit E
MLHTVVDKYNYVDDCAAVCIAQKAGVKPIAVIAAASNYFYIPLKPVGENVFWCCTCQNCQMNGAKDL